MLRRPSAATLVTLLLCGAVGAADAAPSLSTVLDRRLPERLRGRPKAAGSPKLLPGSAKPYAAAKEALRRGEPKAALRALRGTRFGLLADREQLLRGDAMAALGDHRAAMRAYVKALDKAEVLDVGLDAARGLRRALHALGQRKEELLVTEALLDIRGVDHRPDLLLAKADCLRALGQKQDAADQAWRLILAYPSSAAAKSAEDLLTTLKKRGAKVPAADSRVELSRIANLIRGGAFTKAERALKRFEQKFPSLASAATLQRLELLRRRGKRTAEKDLLLKLRAKGLSPDEGPKVLYRLARLAMGEDDNAAAIALFDELTKKFPKSALAKEGEYLAAWLPYNSGDNLETNRRMSAFAERHPRSPLRTEALWYAGWSAYVANKPKLAQKAWKTLLDDHGRSELVTHAHYWLGRVAQQQKAPDEAKMRYQAVRRIAPMSYYGFWAQARLEELGEKITLQPAPKAKPPGSIGAAIGRLGPKRPRLVDRGVALHAAGLQREAEVELRAAARSLYKVRDNEGRTLIADMLHQLGAHFVAFRLASSITREGGELSDESKSWAWRAWRQSYPNAYADEVDAAHKAHAIEKNLVWAVMRTESSFRPWIRSPAGARGLMQIMPATARAIGRRAKGGRRHAKRFKDPGSNVWLGAWYLKELSDRYDGQLAATVAAYNAGPIAMDRWIKQLGGAPLDEFVERIPYKETRRYTRRVIESYLVYRRMKGLPMLKLGQVLEKTAPNGTVNF